MNSPSTSSAEFFEAKYTRLSDPWDFAHNRDEQCRYDRTVSALAHRRYQRAFEPGCSVGALTERLAGICDLVEAIDFSETAIATARARCAHLLNVRFDCRPLSERLPVNGFDLLVLSEIGYYFSPDVWREISAELVAAMSPKATLLGVHWLGHSADHCMHGDPVHEILGANSQLRLEYGERHEAFRLDRWVRL
jgi:SAM-dependent methyltransferase